MSGLVRIDRPDPAITGILSDHFALMRATSPEESCHVMQPEALFASGAVVLAWRQGDEVLGIGALKPLDAAQGELKSMHTRAAARGQGVAQGILAGLIDVAGEIGLTRVSLETGTAPEFAAARRLYTRNGFRECAPFGDYVPDPLSVFMTRDLSRH